MRLYVINNIVAEVENSIIMITPIEIQPYLQIAISQLGQIHHLSGCEARHSLKDVDYNSNIS